MIKAFFDKSHLGVQIRTKRLLKCARKSPLSAKIWQHMLTKRMLVKSLVCPKTMTLMNIGLK